MADGLMLPTRYLAWFANVWATRYRSRFVVAWACHYCGKQIRTNTAGAQSHVTMHVRKGITTAMVRRAAAIRRGEHGDQ